MQTLKEYDVVIVGAGLNARAKRTSQAATQKKFKQIKKLYTPKLRVESGKA